MHNARGSAVIAGLEEETLVFFYENGEKESGKAASHHHAHDWICFDDSMSVLRREGSLLRRLLAPMGERVKEEN